MTRHLLWVESFSVPIFWDRGRSITILVILWDKKDSNCNGKMLEEAEPRNTDAAGKDELDEASVRHVVTNTRKDPVSWLETGGIQKQAA